MAHVWCVHVYVCAPMCSGVEQVLQRGVGRCFSHGPLPLPPNTHTHTGLSDRVQLSYRPQGQCALNKLIQMENFGTMDGLPLPE